MKWLWVLPALWFTGLAIAQPPLELKGLRGGQPEGAGHRRHMLVQFKQEPDAEQLRALQDRGARILEYVPQFAYVISAPGVISLNDLDLAWSGSLTAREKVSPAYKENPASRASFAVIEFYADIPMPIARGIVTAANLQIHDNAYLLANDLLVSGSAQAVQALARFDEVEYIFPASDDLVEGRSVNACPGALTTQGQVGQSVPKVGSWAPVGGSANLQYAFAEVTEKLAAPAAESEIVRALDTWSKYVQVNWAETSDASAGQTIAIRFATGAHGDGYPFGGPGGVIAHTFYPYPVSAEPLAGDMHFNDAENWQIGANIDLFSVALHEAGHALGLGHSDEPTAVMYPYYHQVTDLSAEDIGAIQTLYASRESASAPQPLAITVVDPGSSTSSSTLSLAGSTTGGVAPIAVVWVTDTQVSGTASGSTSWTVQGIPLHLGMNSVTISATDAQHVSATKSISINCVAAPSSTSTSGPALQIVSPASSGTYNTVSPNVAFTGIASDEGGIAQVRWTTSSGDSGVAYGTTNWSFGPLAVNTGITTLSITAVANDGRIATQSLQVQYMPPLLPGSNSAPPTLIILSPASVTVAVDSPSIAVSGTATSSAGIASVTWSTSSGDSGIAQGTTQWVVPAIPLSVGANTITITAYDPSGNSCWRSLVVTYYASN